MIRGQLRLVRRLWQLHPPWELQWHVIRWSWALFAREFALQFALLVTLAIVALLALGAAGTTLGIVALALLAADLAFLLRLGWQSWRSAAAIDRELQEVPGEPAATGFPRSHLAIPLLMLVPRGVRKRRGVLYHSAGTLRLRLDVYRAAGEPPDDEPRPAVIQVHGGGWIAGSRLEQGIPLLNHMAANGWVGFNIDYRLSPRATLPDHVIDVKRAIASVAAAVPFYGVYDMLDEDVVYYEGLRSWLLEEIVIKRRRADDPEAFRAVSPTHRVHSGAPPFLVFHGERDTLVPPGDARTVVEPPPDDGPYGRDLARQDGIPSAA